MDASLLSSSPWKIGDAECTPNSNLVGWKSPLWVFVMNSFLECGKRKIADRLGSNLVFWIPPFNVFGIEYLSQSAALITVFL